VEGKTYSLRSVFLPGTLLSGRLNLQKIGWLMEEKEMFRRVGSRPVNVPDNVPVIVHICIDILANNGCRVKRQVGVLMDLGLQNVHFRRIIG
jgi:hypothetical protein